MEKINKLLEKIIFVQEHIVKTTEDPEWKQIEKDILIRLKSKKWTEKQCRIIWHDLLAIIGLKNNDINSSTKLKNINQLLIENFGEGEGLAPEKWKMNRKIRAILKRGIRDADEARMVGDYIDQLADDEEIRKCETLLMEFEMKINDLLQKESISSKSDYTFLSKYRMELNDDTEGARRIDEMLNNFSKKSS